MSKIVPQYDLSKVSDTEDFKRYSSILIGQLVSALNGNLDFTNLITQQVSVTFPATANANFAIQHNLGKTGVNYIVTSKNVTCDIYRGTGDTMNIVYLKSTAGGVGVALILY